MIETHLISHVVCVAVDDPTRPRHIQRKFLAPFAGVHPDGGFLFAEECLLAEREQNRSFVLRWVVEDVGILIVGLYVWAETKRGVRT